MFNRLLEKCAGCGNGRPPLCSDCSSGLSTLDVSVAVPGIDQVDVAYVYEGTAKSIVTVAKFGSRPAGLDWLGSQMAARVREIDVDCVTWVPGSWEGRLQRGFDPSQLLARRVAKALRADVRRLIGRGPGLPQRSRSLQGRAQGPALEPTWRSVPERVLLVDDVMTTGASLAAAAELLRWCGARSVFAIVGAAAPAPQQQRWSA